MSKFIMEDHFMKTKIKRSLSFALMLTVILSMFSGVLPVFAMDLTKSYEVSWDHVLTDEDGNAFTWYAGLNAADNPYGYTINAVQRSMHDYTVKRLGLTGNNTNWEYDTDYVYAYCIEHGIPIPNSTEYKGSDSPTHGNKWEAMSANQRDLIMLALTYGYPNRHVSTSKDANACYSATQLIVWQISLGFRTSPTALNDKTYPMSGHTGTMTEQLTRNSYFRNFYNAILNDMERHNIRPSFTGSSLTAPVYDMTESGGQYRVSLTDTNGVLSEYYISNNAGLNASISGNVLTITSNSPITSDKMIELKRSLPTSNFTTGFLIWSVPGKEGANQDMVTGVDSDPRASYLQLRVSTGNLAIIKTSQHNNGVVGGFQFEVRNSSGTLLGTYTSDSSGVINVPNLVAGTYSVKEVNLSSDFVAPSPNPKSVEVRAGQTASVSFDNIKKRGIISVRKTDANPTLGGYSLAGAVFEIRDQGGTLVDTITTGSDGRAQSKILPLGVYRVKETQAPYGFLLDTNTHNVALSGTQGSGEVVYAPDTTVAEQPEVARINIQKSNKNKMMGDYNLAGAKYEIRAAEDIKRVDGSFYAHKGDLMETITTDAQGKAQSKDLRLGKYEIFEVTAPYGYVLDSVKHPVTLSYGGQTVPVVYETVTSGEEPQHGVIRIHKYNKTPDMGDYPLNGAVFEIRAANDIKCLDGTVIYNKGDLADTVTTNAAGEAQTKEIPLGAYTVREKTAPFGFVLNTIEYNPVLSYAGQNVAVTYTDVSVPEEPQTGTITITKLDKVTGTRAQGDSTLKGAVFELYAAEDIKRLNGSTIYAKDQLVETLYCGSNSSVTSKEVPLGSYYYKEKVPPVGYTLDTASYPVTIEYAGQNVAVVKKYGDLKNKVIEGQIAITKHTDDPDPDVDPANPQVEAPLDGAVFNIWLKSAGSYDNALPTERDQITTDENGYAKSKLLPYGVYTVAEQPNENDVKLVEPFDVFVSKDGNVYRYILSDPWFRSLVKVIKVDAETGKTIPAAGVSFKIKDLSTGDWVVQHINYPTPIDIDVYETAPDGTLVMPETLKSGQYELYEQAAPYGYILTKNPVPFTIHSSQTDPEVAEVIMANKPAKGIIKLSKTGNMLTSVEKEVTQFGDRYIPVFSEMGLANAVFNIVAAEDIYTGDGTLRYAKGTVVDTITTNASGYAESKQLYLGNYEVIEVQAPKDFVLDATVHNISLVYENQEVPVVFSQIGLGNTRQQVEIELQKLMEQPVDAPDDFNAFGSVIFGLFADQDITAADGSVVIPKDGLIALMLLDANGKSIVAGELPLAKYYVKELQTSIYYQLNETKYPVNAEYQGQNVAVAKVLVNNGGIAIPNELKLGKIVVTKTGEMLVGSTQRNDKDDVLYTPVFEYRGLPGAKFNVVAAQDVYDVYGKRIHKKGDIVDTITTGADGKAETKLLHLAHYELVEIEFPFGYVGGNAVYPVSLSFDGEVSSIITKSVSLQNERQKVLIDLEKICEEPENAPEDFNPYSDILFALYAREDILTVDGDVAIPAGGLIEYIMFEQDGKTEVKTDLPFGSFYIQEILGPFGYVVDETQYDIVFDYDAEGGAVIPIHVNDGNPIENRLQRGSLKVIKTFEGKDYPIAGIPFTIEGTTSVGTTVKIEAVTDENGEILLENLLVGNYVVTELESELSHGYVLSPEENAIVAHEQITEMTINNKLERGSLKIIKTFEGKTYPIPGVPFTVTGITVLGDEFSGEYVTDENGEIFIENLIVGDYVVKELASDLTEGYVLSPEENAVVAHEQITELTINNKLIRGNVKLIKLDGDNPDRKLSGAVFELYQDSNGNRQLDDTDLLLGTLDETEAGIYEKLAIEYGGYFILEKEAPKGFVKDDSPYYFKIVEDGETVLIENTPGSGFINKSQRGSLKIIKSSADGKLEGFAFLVEGNGYSQTFTTNASGEILIENLLVGTYTVKELENEVSKGYILPEMATVEIIADETLELHMHNDKTPDNPDNPDIPKTGDNSNIGFWLILMLASAGGLVLASTAFKKRRNQN